MILYHHSNSVGDPKLLSLTHEPVQYQVADRGTH